MTDTFAVLLPETETCLTEMSKGADTPALTATLTDEVDWRLLRLASDDAEPKASTSEG